MMNRVRQRATAAAHGGVGGLGFRDWALATGVRFYGGAEVGTPMFAPSLVQTTLGRPRMHLPWGPTHFGEG